MKGLSYWLSITVIIVSCQALGSSSRDDVLNSSLELHPKALINIPLRPPLYSVAWSPNGSLLAILGASDLTIYDVKRSSTSAFVDVLRRLYSGKSLAFIDSQTILMGGDSSLNAPNAIALFALSLLHLDNRLHSSGIPILSATSEARQLPPEDIFDVAKDKSRLAAIDNIGAKLFVYDLSSGSILFSVNAPDLKTAGSDTPNHARMYKPQDFFTAVAVSKANRNVIAACSYTGKVYIFNAEEPSRSSSIQLFRKGFQCTALSFSPDGSYLAAGKSRIFISALDDRSDLTIAEPVDKPEESVKIWSIADGKQVSLIHRFVGTIEDIQWNEAGSVLAVADQKSIQLFRPESNTSEFPLIGIIQAESFKISYSKDGLLAAVQGNKVVIYDGGI